MKRFCMINFFLLILFVTNSYGGDEIKEKIFRENLYLKESLKNIDDEWIVRKQRYEKEIVSLKKRIKKIENNFASKGDKLSDIGNKNDFFSNIDSIEKNIIKKTEKFFPSSKTEKNFYDSCINFFEKSSSLNEYMDKEKKIIIAGLISGIYKTDDTSGFIIFDKNKISFIENSYYGKEIDSVFNNTDSFFPIIFTKDIKMETDLFFEVSQYIEKGGAMIWPIILTGILGIILSIMQGVILFIKKIPSKEAEEKIFKILRSGNIPEQDYKKYPSLFPITEVLRKNENKTPNFELVESLFDKNLARLEKYIPTIGVLAGIAPLLGLLGTVTGMILTFNAVGGQGSARAAEMATGISEALITTQLGLAIALPLMVIHHFYEQRVDKFAFDMEEKKNLFLGLIKQNELSE